jgi:hypothetical protein
MNKLVLFSATAAAAISVNSATINVPGDKPSIQEGVDAATFGDTVLVACGTYHESDIYLEDSGVAIIGAGEETRCVVIDVQDQGRGFYFDHVSGPSLLKGLVITNALAPDTMHQGGGILCDHSALAIENCRIDHCKAGNGGGIHSSAGSLHLEDCEIQSNIADLWGGGIYASYSTVDMVRCQLDSNSSTSGAGGAYIMATDFTCDSLSVRFNTTEGNGGGLKITAGEYTVINGSLMEGNVGQTGAAIHGQSVTGITLVNGTIVDNEAGGEGAALFFQDASVTVNNTIIAFSSAVGMQWNEWGVMEGSCLDVYGNSGGEMLMTAGEFPWEMDTVDIISIDPRFCDPETGNYGIYEDSHCSPAYSPCGTLVGYFQPGCSCCTLRGDIDGDGQGPDISDLVYMVDYMFGGGQEPACMQEADINGDGVAIDIADMVALVDFMFGNGPAPVVCP